MGTATSPYQPELAYDLEYLFTRRTQLHQPYEVIGPTPDGIRVNLYTAGGTVEGPALSGRALGVGGDWLTLRPDGVGLIDSRVTMQAEDEALIYMHYTGIVDFGPDAYEQFLAGNLPTPGPLRIAPRFQTAAPDYLWLNRIQALGIGEYRPDAGGNFWEIYAIQ